MTMTLKTVCWSLSFVCLTIVSTTFSLEEYFYETSAHDNNFVDANIITLTNTRIRRSPLAPPTSTPQQKSTYIPPFKENNNATKINGELNQSIILSSMNDSEKILGSNLSLPTPKSPVQESSGNKNNTGSPQSIDLGFPSPITNETLLNHNITKTKNDSHTYYNSTIINDKSVFDKYWVDLTTHPNASIHEMLSDAHRRAATISLKFKFQFYGHLINSTTIATGGFLYLGEYIHSWLAATQYIAPLMANFDLSTSNDSNIYYMDNGTAFTVTWHNVVLQDKPSAGGFTFQTTLHSNGNVVFVYQNLPMKIKDIDFSNHPVKIGLSDAYIMDKTEYFMRRKTIFEYHRIAFHEDEVTNGTVIFLTALPTCLERKNCTSCMKKDIDFECFWCDNRCSSGVDRNRQEWQKKDCEKLKLNDKDICATATGAGNHSTHDNSSEEEFTKPVSRTDSSHSNTGLFLIALCLSLIIMSTVWILYAYMNPHTRSGQMLIRYRPNQWSWKKGEARYTAATVHM